ncbi:hypothetical protein ACHWQZ_G015538 [Mnemiopsis leidyi]
MMSGDPHCFGHPTKVTFTFSEKCLKNENPNFPPYASYWSASPYGENSAYNIQTWLANKMKTQRQKLKLEKAVQRAERKLQIEYDKQMELKRKAADEKFKMWLKSKGFANQSPVMLYRGPHHCLPNTSPSSTTLASTDSKRPTTARVRSVETPNSGNTRKTKGILRPRSASATGNRKQITSTLDTKATKPSCKALGQDEYMKMRHLAGKRYTKLKSEKSGFQCEDQLLRKLQDLDWEEKCIKNKMVFSEKEDLDKVRAKALKRGKKKLKFKGDVITVEVEEIDSNADVDITFEEVDDKCSDIGCIEREGVDFLIESRETIDLSDRPDEEQCRPMTAEPPKIECEVLTPSRPSRPKSAKPQSHKKDLVKKSSVDSKVSNAKDSEQVVKKQEVEKKAKKAENSEAPKVKVKPSQETSPSVEEKKVPQKKAAAQTKEDAKPSPKKELPSQDPSKPSKDSPVKSEVPALSTEDTQKGLCTKVEDRNSGKDSGEIPAVEAKKPSTLVEKPSVKEPSLESDKKETISSDKSPSLNGGVLSPDNETLPNGKVETVSDVEPEVETAVANSKIASDSFFD